MPIEGATLGEAVSIFRDHLNTVLARTVTPTPLIVFKVQDRLAVAFRQHGQPIRARLHTAYGSMGLFVGQVCDSTVTAAGRHRLRTVQYSYTLTPEDTEEPVLRWEYVKELPGGEQWCRHHLQGTVHVPFGRMTRLLNDLHLPTGFVTIEEVLRFCIVDLGVQALSDQWHEILTDSYERFKGDFAPRGML